jgi:hypothetical protein
MPNVILIAQRYSPMSFRSYFLLLFFSLIYTNVAYPILILVEKFTRNGQTVYLLGDYHSRGKELAQEEKAQIDLVLAALNEHAQERQRKVRILYEKGSTTARFCNFMNWEKVYRFTINIDELIPELNNPDITLHDMENRVVAGEIGFLLHCNGDLKYQDGHFDRDKAPKELKDIMLKDLFDELHAQAHALEEDINNIPTEPEKERCREQLKYCMRNIDFLKQDLGWVESPEEKPFIELAKQLGRGTCEELLNSVVNYSSSLFEANIGHHIMKSNPNEDIVVIAGALHMNPIEQYMIGLGWKRDVYCGNYERDLVTQDELDSVMRHKYFSERILHQLKELSAQTHHSISTTYAVISTYLKALGAPSSQAE